MNPASSTRDPAFERLLAQRELWDIEPAGGDGESTGFAALDEHLATGGWPRGALTELWPERAGIGELRLLMPALARLSHGTHWVAWIDPPYAPHAAGLHASGVDLAHTLIVRPQRGAGHARERFRALEQALASGTCSAVLAWPGQLDADSMQRLQRAASRGNSLGFLFRWSGEGAEQAPSSTVLRLALASHRGGLRIDNPDEHHEPIHLPATELFHLGRRGADSALPAGAG
jgi:cell division inhibitor SulA